MHTAIIGKNSWKEEKVQRSMQIEMYAKVFKIIQNYTKVGKIIESVHGIKLWTKVFKECKSMKSNQIYVNISDR